MDDSVGIEYYSETFARMSVAYAAAHEDAPTEPGPAYKPTVDDGSEPLPISLTEQLALSQEEFEAWVSAAVRALVDAEAAETYIPEETDGLISYSAVNGGDIWRMTEDDSVNFYRDGEALGVPGLYPVMNEEGGIDQDLLNGVVDVRLMTPSGGYERAHMKDAQLMRIIAAYVKGHAEGPTEEHYRELINGVKMAMAEEEAAARVEKLKADLLERGVVFETVDSE